jgi:hypothetical protein
MVIDFILCIEFFMAGMKVKNNKTYNLKKVPGVDLNGRRNNFD